MVRGSYERISIEQFGRHLILTKDLDPVYCALTAKNSALKGANLKRWLIAYWCLYHCGFACFASEASGNDFWELLEVAARNEEPPTSWHIDLERWPRGHERRHWRGKQAIDCVAYLRKAYSDAPEDMVDYIVAQAPDYKNVTNAARAHYLFGPWISFKIADMVDRCLGVHVDFTSNAVFMFTDPLKAALMVWRDRLGVDTNVHPKSESEVVSQVVSYLKEQFQDLKAPPFGDRPIDLQEIETCLCKWKSMQNGHYPPYNDILEINHGLVPWTEQSKTAKKFLEVMPKAPENASWDLPVGG